jgi:hypothetical protein
MSYHFHYNYVKIRRFLRNLLNMQLTSFCFRHNLKCPNGAGIHVTTDNDGIARLICNTHVTLFKDKKTLLQCLKHLCRSCVVIETPQHRSEGDKFIAQQKVSFKICYIICKPIQASSIWVNCRQHFGSIWGG